MGYVNSMAGRDNGGTSTPRKLKTNASGQQENPVGLFSFLSFMMDVLLTLG